MNKYEGIVILKGDLDEKVVEEEYTKIEDTIKKHEGKIERSEKWGKKRLAYGIEKFREGFFLFVTFEAAPESIKTLTELFKLDSNILRAQIVRNEK